MAVVPDGQLALRQAAIAASHLGVLGRAKAWAHGGHRGRSACAAAGADNRRRRLAGEDGHDVVIAGYANASARSNTSGPAPHLKRYKNRNSYAATQRLYGMLEEQGDST